MTHRSKWPLLAALAAAVALGMAIYIYLVPLTGATGKPAPVLVGAGALAVTLGALLLFFLQTGGFARVLMFLCVLGAVLTALAGWFLLSVTIVIAMILAAVAVLIHSMIRKTESPLA